MSVEVEFIANGRRYKVFRGRGRRSSPDAVLYREGSLIRAGDNGVTREIEEVIDLDKNLFSNAIYIKQGEIADLITKKPNERKKIIARLLGIDDLQKAWENMRSVIDEYDKRKSRIEGRLEDFGQTKEEGRRKEEEKGEIKEAMRVCESNMGNARRDLEMVEREKELFDKKEDEFNRLSQMIEHEEKLLKVAYDNKERLEENIGSIEGKEKEIKKIEPEIKKIPILEDIKDNITVRNGLDEKIENVREDIKRIEGYQEITHENKEGYDFFIKLGDEIDELSDERKEFEGSRNLREAYRKEEERVFADIERLNRNISEKLAEYGKILNIDARSVFDLDRGLEIVTSDLEDELKDKEDSIKEISSKRYDLNGQNSEIKKARDELSGAKDRCPVCNAKLTEEHKKELLEKYSDHIY
jgi:ATPase involved in DNA repair